MLSRKSPIHAEGGVGGGHGEEQQQTDQAYLRHKRRHGNQLLSNCGVPPVSPVATVTSGNRGKSKTISEEKETLEEGKRKRGSDGCRHALLLQSQTGQRSKRNVLEMP